MHLTRIAIAALSVVVAATPAVAKDFTMNFDGIPKAGTAAESGLPGLAEVLGYYNSDPGPAPVFPRAGNQAWDVTFSAGALAINSFAAGGPGNFATAHSGASAVGALGDAVRLDLDTGVSLSGLNFWYDKLAGTNPTLQLFSDGNDVHTEVLGLCESVGGDGYCGWTKHVLLDKVLTDLAAKGTLVTRIVFAAELGTAVFDDVSLSTSAIPEPSANALMALGLVLVAGAARRRAA